VRRRNQWWAGSDQLEAKSFAELGRGDAVIPPGHDAWVVGDEPNVLLELSALAG
jgi:hypothetical protein